MTGIVLSIILIFGLPGGPTNDFNESTAVDQPVTASQSTNTGQRKK